MVYLDKPIKSEVYPNLPRGRYDDFLNQGGGRTMPKFKFSAKFPICLHVIL